MEHTKVLGNEQEEEEVLSCARLPAAFSLAEWEFERQAEADINFSLRRRQKEHLFLIPWRCTVLREEVGLGKSTWDFFSGCIRDQSVPVSPVEATVTDSLGDKKAEADDVKVLSLFLLFFLSLYPRTSG